MILVTGAAGFIGFHVSRMLLERGEHVVGLDNYSPYYDVGLKRDRVDILGRSGTFTFHEIDLADRDRLDDLFAHTSPRSIVHLAAQAGVRHSLQHPHSYVDANLVGFVNILEQARRHEIEHFVYASSSSVYGANTNVPYSVHEAVDHPVSLYAATKKANELMAHSYSHLFNLPTTGLRFFTVYGPWGRPDMAAFKFTRAILRGEPIDLYNHGDMSRDFTYIDDAADAVVRILATPATPDPAWRPDRPDPASSSAPYRVYNVGNSRPVGLKDFVQVLGDCLGRPVLTRMLPLQPGDLPVTNADTSDLAEVIGIIPGTPIEIGLARFAEWYCDYYGVDRHLAARRNGPALAAPMVR